MDLFISCLAICFIGKATCSSSLQMWSAQCARRRTRSTMCRWWSTRCRWTFSTSHFHTSPGRMWWARTSGLSETWWKWCWDCSSSYWKALVVMCQAGPVVSGVGLLLISVNTGPDDLWCRFLHKKIHRCDPNVQSNWKTYQMCLIVMQAGSALCILMIRQIIGSVIG